MDEAVAADPDRYEAIITTNEKPTFVFEKEPFFGQHYRPADLAHAEQEPGPPRRTVMRDRGVGE